MAVYGADNRSKTQQITICIYCVLFYLNDKIPELIPILISLLIEEQNKLFTFPFYLPYASKIIVAFLNDSQQWLDPENGLTVRH